jgi:hypothetical protein
VQEGGGEREQEGIDGHRGASVDHQAPPTAGRIVTALPPGGAPGGRLESIV